MKTIGLTSAAAEENRRKYGSNRLSELPSCPLWKRVLLGFTDPMILILCAALVIQTLMFLFHLAEWYEPAGVLVAILIANGVASFSAHRQARKAKALKEEKEAGELAKVFRDGVLTELPVSQIVVHDILFLQAGDKISADAEVVSGTLSVDQATLNGETEEAEKRAHVTESYDERDLLNPYGIYRGTVVCSGEAYAEVKKVGDKTLFGQLALQLQENTRSTPLQVKLNILAKQISLFGYIGAGAIISAILLKTILSGAEINGLSAWIRLIVNAATVAVTIIVCAVPEGLPMLTSLLLSLQSMRMAKDNVLVRKINGLETAGSLNLLFCDKTGTITEGKLGVTEILLGHGESHTALKTLSAAMKDTILAGIGLNNSAVYSGESIVGGNSTDRALIAFLVNENLANTIEKSSLVAFEPFDSFKKYSSATVKTDSGTVSFIKGAPEKILEKCPFRLDENGQVQPFCEKDSFRGLLDERAARSIRLIAVARKEECAPEYALVCVLCIRDNVRKEAVSAIEEVQNAGIQVVMITGDRKETAAAVARETKLLSSSEDLILTSSDLAEMEDEKLKILLPHLRVIARALPTDKSRLVRVAQELNLVVGMTGDGVNDAPALKKADVGFAMGSGTEVAKEAGDIIILDNNFSSIEKAILYGRTMFKNIRKFLVFQLSVNVAAVAVCFLGPLFGINIVMTVIQLLFVNLVMDTLAAIAYGSEPVSKEYMRERPVPRSAHIVNVPMFFEILTAAFVITVFCLGILFFAPLQRLFGTTDLLYLRTAVFATFMMSITLNGFHVRTSHLNPFSGLFSNIHFLVIMGSIFVMQFLFVTFGGETLSVVPLGFRGWCVCGILAIAVLAAGTVGKILSGFLMREEKSGIRH